MANAPQHERAAARWVTFPSAMLHSLRKSSSSVFAWLLLGALAMVFGLSFGLPSDTLTLGDRPLASVHGERVTRDDFVYQYNTVMG